MNDQTVSVGRRRFLQSSLLAAGSATFGTALARAGAPESRKIVADSTLPTRKFGKTGHTLPILGMGGSAMVRIFISAYGAKLLSMDERVAMVRHAYDQGIRYFDTARVYGESEKIMGQGLKGVRDKVYVATKVAVSNPARVRQSLEDSLKQLDMDYVDAVQIHSPAIEAVGFKGGMKIHAELVKLRDEKLCRFIGLTTHVAFETVHQMIATGGFDQVLLAYGYFRRGMDTLQSHRNLELRELCLAKAADLGMGVVAMKIMGAAVLGHNAKNIVPGYDAAALERLPAAAIRWVLQDDRISMLNIGVSFPEDIDRNVAVLKGDPRLTREDRRLLADFCRRAYEAEPIKKMPLV
jgi:aryl-alcohol dehydrogenase-like predicted oxidoreductase